MTVDERIAEIFKALDEGVIRRPEVYIHVGLLLIECGSATDVSGLPEWVQKDLLEWARDFEKTKTWRLVSSAGEKDFSTRGEKLYVLLKEAGLVCAA